MHSFASSDSCPITIYNASFQQLKRLLLQAQKEPSYSIQSGLLNPAAMHMANVILAHSGFESWRTYFLLCMRFWVDATASFPVLADIAQGYMSLAVQNGGLSTLEARRLQKVLAKKGRRHEAGEFSSVIVDFDGSVERGAFYRANELAERFNELAMFDELTTGNVVQPESDVQYATAENHESK